MDRHDRLAVLRSVCGHEWSSHLFPVINYPIFLYPHRGRYSRSPPVPRCCLTLSCYPQRRYRKRRSIGPAHIRFRVLLSRPLVNQFNGPVHSRTLPRSTLRGCVCVFIFSCGVVDNPPLGSKLEYVGITCPIHGVTMALLGAACAAYHDRAKAAYHDRAKVYP